MAYNIYHISTIISSFLIHLAIYKWFAGWILRKVSPLFATLAPSKQILLRNGVTSAAHGAVVGGLSWYVFLYPGGALPDKVWYDVPMVRHTICYAIGYALADLLLLLFIIELRDSTMVVHHFIMVWGGYPSTVIPVLPYYSNLVSMWELSNPFLHMRFILQSMGKKNSPLYKLNGILLLVVFFACRVATIPLWFQLAPLMATGELYEVGTMMLISIFVLTPIVYGLNIYWFSKMCRGAHRLLYQS